jgi:phosphoglycolate phosphatase-like HAD superfamily hydrolase
MSASVLFDLDDTLVDTEHLRAFRDQGDWGQITASVISKIKPFDGVPELLNRLTLAGFKIAIVSTSPRWYAEKILKNLGLPYDALVASWDTKWGKPDRAPSKLALERLGHQSPSPSFVVGDRCIDIASGDQECDWTIGASWATKNLRDLMLSYPKFLAKSPAEVGEIIFKIIDGSAPKPYAWGKDVGTEVWLESPSWDRRKHLTNAGILYKFARVYRGRSNSWTDDRIRIFKTKNRNQLRYKRFAAALFAFELNSVIPDGSWVVFVLPAALKGTVDYDDRWEIVEEMLGKYAAGKNLKFCQAIVPTSSSTPAHLQGADSPDRDPAVIKARLKWVGGIPPETSDVTIIDDVLTVGGHLRAYHDIVKENCPNSRIHVVAWAIYSSEPWYSCPSATA